MIPNQTQTLQDVVMLDEPSKEYTEDVEFIKQFDTKISEYITDIFCSLENVSSKISLYGILKKRIFDLYTSNFKKNKNNLIIANKFFKDPTIKNIFELITWIYYTDLKTSIHNLTLLPDISEYDSNKRKKLNILDQFYYDFVDITKLEYLYQNELKYISNSILNTFIDMNQYSFNTFILQNMNFPTDFSGQDIVYTQFMNIANTSKVSDSILIMGDLKRDIISFYDDVYAKIEKYPEDIYDPKDKFRILLKVLAGLYMLVFNITAAKPELSKEINFVLNPKSIINLYCIPGLIDHKDDTFDITKFVVNREIIVKYLGKNARVFLGVCLPGILHALQKTINTERDMIGKKSWVEKILIEILLFMAILDPLFSSRVAYNNKQIRSNFMEGKPYKIDKADINDFDIDKLYRIWTRDTPNGKNEVWNYKESKKEIESLYVSDKVLEEKIGLFLRWRNYHSKNDLKAHLTFFLKEMINDSTKGKLDNNKVSDILDVMIDNISDEVENSLDIGNFMTNFWNTIMNKPRTKKKIIKKVIDAISYFNVFNTSEHYLTEFDPMGKDVETSMGLNMYDVSVFCEKFLQQVEVLKLIEGKHISEKEFSFEDINETINESYDLLLRSKPNQAVSIKSKAGDTFSMISQACILELSLIIAKIFLYDNKVSWENRLSQKDWFWKTKIIIDNLDEEQCKTVIKFIINKYHDGKNQYLSSEVHQAYEFSRRFIIQILKNANLVAPLNEGQKLKPQVQTLILRKYILKWWLLICYQRYYLLGSYDEKYYKIKKNIDSDKNRFKPQQGDYYINKLFYVKPQTLEDIAAGVCDLHQQDVKLIYPSKQILYLHKGRSRSNALYSIIQYIENRDKYSNIRGISELFRIQSFTVKLQLTPYITDFQKNEIFKNVLLISRAIKASSGIKSPALSMVKYYFGNVKSWIKRKLLKPPLFSSDYLRDRLPEIERAESSTTNIYTMEILLGMVTEPLFKILQTLYISSTKFNYKHHPRQYAKVMNLLLGEKKEYILYSKRYDKPHVKKESLFSLVLHETGVLTMDNRTMMDREITMLLNLISENILSMDRIGSILENPKDGRNKGILLTYSLLAFIDRGNFRFDYDSSYLQLAGMFDELFPNILIISDEYADVQDFREYNKLGQTVINVQEKYRPDEMSKMNIKTIKIFKRLYRIYKTKYGSKNTIIIEFAKKLSIN